jgi:hypothetical protein
LTNKITELIVRAREKKTWHNWNNRSETKEQ